MHHPSSPTTITLSQTVLPPFPDLEVNVLGESSQLTDMTPVVEPSFGDLVASASSRNRRSFVASDQRGIGVHGGWKNEFRPKMGTRSRSAEASTRMRAERRTRNWEARRARRTRRGRGWKQKSLLPFLSSPWVAIHVACRYFSFFSFCFSG